MKAFFEFSSIYSALIVPIACIVSVIALIGAFCYNFAKKQKIGIKTGILILITLLSFYSIIPLRYHFYGLAFGLIGSQNLELGRKNFKKLTVYSLNPAERNWAREEIAESYLYEGDIPKAIKWYEQVNPYYAKYTNYYLTGSYLAIGECNKAFQAAKKYKGTSLNYYEVYVCKKDYKKAIEYYNSISKDKPADYAMMARLYKLDEQNDIAQEYYKKAISLSKNDKEIQRVKDIYLYNKVSSASSYIKSLHKEHLEMLREKQHNNF